MTVAVVILPASADEALVRIDARPRIRRLVDAAWAGGAVPVVVVVADPDGAVAVALAGAPATLVEPGADSAAAAVTAGARAAVDEVSETDAVMVWPAAYAWLDPETLTSLIEAHGVTPEAILRPTYDGHAGWPVLIPGAWLPPAAPGASGTLDDLLASVGAPTRLLDLGDPGAVHDADTAATDLPPYQGPVRPTGSEHEWGSPGGQEPDPS
jgi:CTP:molybdopterin cytidylyltransferase MocA